MAKKSIATRWFVNSFSAVLVLAVIVNVALFFSMKSSYYSAVNQYLSTEANVISGVLLRYYGDSAVKYSSEIRNSVEEFEKKNQMELMAINSTGKVELTSSGFQPAYDYDMPDYQLALESEDGTGSYVGYLSDAEKYMAVTSILSPSGSGYSAIRVITSLDAIDMQIYMTVLFTVVLSVGVLLFLLLLGLYFVKSIVSPLRQVSYSAQKLARGDYSVKIEYSADDEVGELCGVFNHLVTELKNSDQIKNDFISSVSHELRTPLTAIKGWSETMLEMRDEDTIKKGMGVITAETERLSGMVEELLDFSRIQNGQLKLQMTGMDVLAELADAVLVYAERARREGIVLNYEEPDGVAIINGDKNRIRQVFINIIDNAIKYSKNAGKIDITADIGAAEIEISVTDSGVGISAEDLPKVKQKFFKSNNTVRGSGIGLAVADEIISQHGGRLTIASVLGQGTTVTITLPLTGGKKQ